MSFRTYQAGVGARIAAIAGEDPTVIPWSADKATARSAIADQPSGPLESCVHPTFASRRCGRSRSVLRHA